MAAGPPSAELKSLDYKYSEEDREGSAFYRKSSSEINKHFSPDVLKPLTAHYFCSLRKNLRVFVKYIGL